MRDMDLDVFTFFFCADFSVMKHVNIHKFDITITK